MAMGKGLDAFFSMKDTEVLKKGDSGVMELKISEVEPRRDQPRKHFDQEALQMLANSISQHGVIQPIIVSRSDDGIYRIIAGERRWRASRMAGLTTIPCIVRSYDALMQAEVALIENLQREDLNPIEEALGYQSLIEQFGLTQEKVSEKVGKSRPAIANMLRLLSLEEEIQEMLSKGSLSSGHARALLAIDDSRKRLEMAKRAERDNLSVREMENIARLLSQTPPKRKVKSDVYPDALKIIKDKFKTRVKLTSENKGKIEIAYYSEEDLMRIVDIIQGL